MTARVTDAAPDPNDAAVEGALRPTSLQEFVGQERVKSQLGLVLEAARRRGRAADHVLISGPPGLGKTTLAFIIAAELQAPLRITSGPALQHAGDVAAVLASLQPGEVLFLDEIHRTARAAEEMLYLAMEDFRVDVIVGKGPGATAIPLEIAPFTLVGATTRAGLLPSPLRDRFGFTAHLDFYDPADLEIILRRSAVLLEVPLHDDGAVEIAGRCRGTPRIANRLLRRVRDFAQVHGNGVVDHATARAALELYEVDELGLDRIDRAVLDVLINRFGGGPVGLSTLAVAVGEEPETIETVAEPFLARLGMIIRTPRGRVAAPAAWSHLGANPPLPPQGVLDLGT
ncbi:MAG: Holliday junction branch migration DNA helicase RuvB [Actinobacteria bacterium]|nr:MAG: Holliday junction branch migration DNA helicase RuvB [Actinomycetota bacterium]